MDIPNIDNMLMYIFSDLSKLVACIWRAWSVLYITTNYDVFYTVFYYWQAYSYDICDISYEHLL